MKIGARTKVAKKLDKFIKVAQAQEKEVELEDLKVVDELADQPEEESEELEEEESEEKKEKEGSVEERLEKVEETLEVIVDALSDQKQILEQVIMGETPKDLEEYKEEKEDTEKEKTSDDFGLEETAMSNLRAKRKARLAKAKVRKARTLRDEFKEKSKTYKPFSPPVEITKMKKDIVPSMFKLADLSFKYQKNPPSWQVLDGQDKPVYVIYNTAGMDPKKFASKNFAVGLIKRMKQDGVHPVLAELDAKRIGDTDKTDDTVYKQALTDMKRRFLRAFRLALTAMNKNLVKPNPLKAALFQTLDDLGIDEPQKIVEYAFSKAHNAHFETAIAQAEKYMEMSDEAFVEAENMIDAAETPVPTTAPEVKSGIEAEAMRKRASANSLVLSTQTDKSVDDSLAARLRSALPVPKLWSVKQTG